MFIRGLSITNALRILAMRYGQQDALLLSQLFRKPFCTGLAAIKPGPTSE